LEVLQNIEKLKKEKKAYNDIICTTQYKILIKMTGRSFFNMSSHYVEILQASLYLRRMALHNYGTDISKANVLNENLLSIY